MPRIQTVSITNICGIEHLEFRAGALTVLSGANGAGKTSIIRALASTFDGGHDPELVRKGEEKAEILITLDDGTTIRKRIAQKGSNLEVRTKEGLRVPKEQTFVSSIASGISFDPLRLVTADKKERAKFLLSVMPIEVSLKDIKAAVGNVPMPNGLPVTTDLDGLKSVRDAIFEARSITNRAERDAEGTVKALSASLPADDGKDWGAGIKALENERVDIETQISDARSLAEEQALQAGAAIREELQAKIAALQQEANGKLTTVAENKATALRQIEDTAKPERERLAGEIATVRANADAQQRAKGAREQIEVMRNRIREKSLEAMRATHAIEALDKLRQTKLDALPIPGVEIREGEIFVGGVPFDKLNTGAQFTLSFQIAALANSSFLVADRAEALDPETWEAFQAAAKESGFQIMVARVGVGELKVEVA